MTKSVLTVTLNPSIDISYILDSYTTDSVNRTFKASKTAGGKELNVSRVLHQAGISLCATGLIGGWLGTQLICQLDEISLPHSFYQIKGNTRNCIAILHDGKQTEILEAGPTILKEEQEGFLDHFDRLLDDTEIAIMSGSLALGMDRNFYCRLVEKCNLRRIPTILDCLGKNLKEVVFNKNKPTIIKPNIDELNQLSEKNYY